MYQDVLDAQVIHLGDNLSNHEPIFISLKIDSLPVHISENKVEDNKTKKRPLWSKASAENIANYRNELKTNLDKFIGLICNDVNCNDPKHLINIDINVYSFMSECIDKALHG